MISVKIVTFRVYYFLAELSHLRMNNILLHRQSLCTENLKFPNKILGESFWFKL